MRTYQTTIKVPQKQLEQYIELTNETVAVSLIEVSKAFPIGEIMHVSLKLRTSHLSNFIYFGKKISKYIN